MISLGPEAAYGDDELRLRRKIRLVTLLDVASDIGLEPVSLTVIHALAYLSNALAPVWNLLPFDGKLLKRQRGPYYPALQWDLERLVAQGLVSVSGLRYVKDARRWRIDAEYNLNMKFAHSVLVTAERVGFEVELKSLYRELAQALAALPPGDVDNVLLEDATYGDPMVEISNVVNFGEGHAINYATNAAREFRPDLPLSPDERVHLYVQHMYGRTKKHAG